MSAASAHPCPTCGCETCNPGACADGGPNQIQVVLSGFTNGTCGDCESYNGIFILDRYFGFCSASGSSCSWQYVKESSNCERSFGSGNIVDRLTVRITIDGSGNSQVGVAWRASSLEDSPDFSCLPMHQWLRTLTSSPSQSGMVTCRELVDYEVPICTGGFCNKLSDFGDCNFDGASAFLTAL